MKTYNEQEFLSRQAGEEFDGPQILGMLIADMKRHYEEQHKEVLRRVLGVYDNPIEVKQMINKQLEGESVGNDKETKNHNQMFLL